MRTVSPEQVLRAMLASRRCCWSPGAPARASSDDRATVQALTPIVGTRPARGAHRTRRSTAADSRPSGDRSRPRPVPARALSEEARCVTADRG
jgi:hypothetical protein